MKTSLSEDLKFWQNERPDHSTMYQFLREARHLEMHREALISTLTELLEEFWLAKQGISFEDFEEIKIVKTANSVLRGGMC